MVDFQVHKLFLRIIPKKKTRGGARMFKPIYSTIAITLPSEKKVRFHTHSSYPLSNSLRNLVSDPPGICILDRRTSSVFKCGF